VIAVSGLGSSVTDVNVTVSGLSHTWPDDVGLLLVSPEGPDQKSVILMTDSGGDLDHPASGIDLTFDDAASGPAPDNTKLKSRTYLPSRGTTTATPPADCTAPASFPLDAPAGPYASTLSVFNGTSPKGDWKLYVIDDSAVLIGSITSWSLDISTTPVPTTKEQCKNGGWREFGYPN
jgi:hypothetical protein